MARIAAIRVLFQNLGYDPSPEQWEVHNDDSLQKLVGGGERGGKSLSSAYELVAHKVIDGGYLFWLVAIDYEASRGEWNHLIDIFARIGMLKSHTKSLDPGLIVLKDGTEIHTKSAMYPAKLATSAPDGIIVCEAAQCDYETYMKVVGRLAEKRGWLLMSGTFEGSFGWYVDLWTAWQYPDGTHRSFSLPTWSNKAVFPGGRNDPAVLALERDMTPERFMERHGGQPSKPSNLVIKELNHKIHVGDFLYNPAIPVELAIDPGYAGAYAVEALQEQGEQVIMVDEVYVRDLITEQVITICQKKPWWNLVRNGAIDIAGRQHQGTKAPVDIWRDLAKISLVSSRVGIEDGVDKLRTVLMPHPITNAPGMLVSHKCKGFLSECGAGLSPFGKEIGGPWMRNKDTYEIIDRNDHACKAVIYWLVNKYGFSRRGGKSKSYSRSAGLQPAETR